ncbi:hypothetical protein MRX96_020218 [Rhipicephalus microplus]
MSCLEKTFRLTRRRSMLQAVATSTPQTRRGIESDERDPKSFLWLKMHNYRDNLSALESTRFRRPATRDFQRLVATDKSAAMVDYASSQFKQRDVVYDVLDIDCDFRNEMDGVNRIVDAKTANVSRCRSLGPRSPDVWYRLYHSSKWRHWLPNPRHLLSDRFCYSEPIPEMVATEEQHQIAASGMKLVSCRMYDTIWTMPNLDSWLECYVPFFGLIQPRHPSPDGVGLRHTVIVVHTQKP